MAWKDYPENIPIVTAFGTVYATVTEASHVYLDANSNGKFLEYRSKKWGVSAHLHRQPDESWKSSPDFFYVRGPVGGRGPVAVSHMPPTYCTAVAKVLEAVWSEYVSAHPGVLLEAQQAHVHNAVEEAERKIADKRREIRTLEADILTLQKDLWAMEVQFALEEEGKGP